MKKFIKVNKIYFIILSVFTLCVLFFAIKKNNISDIDLIFLSLVLLFTIFTFNYISIIIYKIHFYPINVFFNLYFLVCFLFFIFNFNKINLSVYQEIFSPIDKISFLNLTKETFKILILTIFFLNLGFLLCLKIFKEKKFNFFPELNDIQLTRLNFFLLLTKLFLIVISLLFSRYIDELINPINLLIVLICFYSAVFFKTNRLLNYFIILYIFFENILLTFGIYKNIILLSVFFILIYNLKKKISNVLLGLLICWVFFGQGLKFDLRIQYNEWQNNEFSDANKSTEPVDYPHAITLRLSEPIVSLVRIIEVERLENREIKKDTISILKYTFIPRFLYPDKPKQDFAKWYTNKFFTVVKRISNPNVTFNIFWPSDFYLNFRYLGSTLFAFIIGVILSFLCAILSNSKASNIHYLFGLSIVSGLSLYPSKLISSDL